MALFTPKKIKPSVDASGKESGKAKPIKSKVPKPSSGAKFILFIGDEGAILVYIKDTVVKSRQFVSDASKQNIDALGSYLAVDKKAPILLVTDSIDQSYVQQTLPPVSSLSVRKLIKRRLDRDFGANDIKGAILLGREKGGRKDWNFMMVALEKTPQLAVWLDFILELPNPFQGICLAAVEVENIIRNLDHAMDSARGNSGSEWKFFVSHNKVGGFRQVILRNGRMVFTRMAQPTAESSPEVIAGNIEQEMISTIEYMRRLSFDANTGLDIYIIASSAIKSAIDTAKFNSRAMHMLTPYEAAKHLGIEGATQPTDQFGDVVLAASIGQTRKHVLTLVTPEAEQLNKMSQWLLYQRHAATAVGMGCILYAGTIAYDIYHAYDAGVDLEQQKTLQTEHLSSLHESLSRSGLDIEKTSDMIDLYKQLLQQSLSPTAVIPKLAQVLKPPIIVKAIDWSLEGSNPSDAGVPANKALAQKMVFTLTLEFPGVTGADGFKVVSRKLLDDLQQTLSLNAADMSFAKVPPAFSEADRLDVTFGNNGPTSLAGQSADVVLVIKKDVSATLGQVK